MTIQMQPIRFSPAKEIDQFITYHITWTDEEGKMLLDLDFVSVKLLKRLFEKDNDEVIYKDKLHSLYAQYDIYFAIWDGLSDDDIIKKMLILNAGQRSVSSVHQFELLFLHFFDDNKLTLDRNIHLYREKQKEYFRIKRGPRNAGEYALASIIIALQSLKMIPLLRAMNWRAILMQISLIALFKGFII
mgnify:CR=1 FL=1